MLTIILTSILISLIFAPLGCLVLWKKYVYFGDGLSHASLLAGSISIIAGIPLIYAGFAVSIVFAIAVFRLKNTSGSNATISLLASLMLSISLIISYLSPARININHLLFGDIISSSMNDAITLSIILIMVYAFITLFYKQVMMIILNKDIAKIQGIKVGTIELGFLILLSLSVFSSLKIIGALLATSILLIPPMTARLVSTTPLQMIIIAVVLALFSNLLGLVLSFYLDMPIAPIIIIIGAGTYMIFYVKMKIRG